MLLLVLVERRSTSVSVEDCEEVVVLVGEVFDVYAGVFHVLPPSFLLDGLPFMWLTA